jgi:hypothetical protein
MVEMLETSGQQTSPVTDFTVELKSRLAAIRSMVTDLAQFAGQIPVPANAEDVAALLELRRLSGLPGFEVGRQQHENAGKNLLDDVRVDVDRLGEALGKMLGNVEFQLCSRVQAGEGGALLSTAEPGLTTQYLFKVPGGEPVWVFDTTRTAWDSRWRTFGTTCEIYGTRTRQQMQINGIPLLPAWVHPDAVRRGLTPEEQIAHAQREAEEISTRSALLNPNPEGAADWLARMRGDKGWGYKCTIVETWHAFHRPGKGTPWQVVATADTWDGAMQAGRAKTSGGELVALKDGLRPSERY